MGKLLSKFVPAPVGGINLLADPKDLKDTEALQLDNYLVYDWGIRERGAFTTVALPDADGVLFWQAFTSATIQGVLIGTTGGKIYVYNGSTFGASLATASAQHMTTFKKKIFISLPAGPNIATYDLDSDSYSGTSFTIPGTLAAPNVSFAFKNRFYVIDDKTAELYYGGVGSISGTLSGPFDPSEYFQRGRYLVAGCSWSFNQGNQNDELMVLANNAGEVFIYSGDWPAAANFQLVARLDLPTLLLGGFGLAASSYQFPTRLLKVGQDVLVITSRGVVSLAGAMAGRSPSDPYFNVSRKVGGNISGRVPDRCAEAPFAFFAAGTDVYCLNYERGAWSKFPSVTSGTHVSGYSHEVCNIACSAAPLDNNNASQSSGYVLFAITNGGFKKLSLSATTNENGTSYVWRTPFFDFGSLYTKANIFIRLIARGISTNTLKNGASINTGYDTNTSTTTDSRTQTTPGMQELNPPGNGTELSYKFAKTGDGTHMNELQGFKALTEEGSVY